MAYVFATLIALVLGVTLRAYSRVLVRRRMGPPLPPTRHARRVKVADTAP